MERQQEKSYVVFLQNDQAGGKGLLSNYVENLKEYGFCRFLEIKEQKVKMFNPVLCLILTSSVFEVWDNDEQCFAEINGQNYNFDFLEGYNEGIKYFEENFELKQSSIYEIDAADYCGELYHQANRLGKHGDNGWYHRVKEIPHTLNNSVVHKYGYYSGIIECINILAKRNISLFKKYFKSDTIREVSLVQTQLDERREFLEENLRSYGFFELAKVKSLHERAQKLLINNIAIEGVPYVIAMFSFLEFLDYLDMSSFNTKRERDHKIASWLSPRDISRTVRGNINCLNSKSTDRKNGRYTAYSHEEEVKNYYESLK